MSLPLVWFQIYVAVPGLLLDDQLSDELDIQISCDILIQRVNSCRICSFLSISMGILEYSDSSDLLVGKKKVKNSISQMFTISISNNTYRYLPC